jgi:hypothetical protein
MPTTATPFTWTLPDITLGDVHQQVHVATRTWTGPLSEIYPSLTGPKPSVQFGHDTEPVMLSDSAYATAPLASAVGIPLHYYNKLTAGERDYNLSHRIQYAPEEDVTVSYRDGFVVEIWDAEQERIDPRELVDVAMDTIGADATVVDWRSNPVDFQLDVVVDEAARHGIGGDLAVGDITRGGLRIFQDRRKNMAPWVQPFLYRLECTNGLQTSDYGLRVEGRGKSIPDILNALKGAARRAFDRVEDDIKAYYDLRDRPISGDAAQYARRVAEELKLPARWSGMVQAMVGPGATEWDVVNLFTNLANSPQAADKRTLRQRLQIAGGAMVRHHAERCTVCQRRID